MARRQLITVYCTEPGCTESPALFEYGSAHEAREAFQRRKKYPYRCTRHTAPNEVLGEANPECTQVLVASKVPGLKDLYWREEGAERAQSGFAYGPGFKAYAKDFPEGTRLVVTARIELPEAGE